MTGGMPTFTADDWLHSLSMCAGHWTPELIRTAGAEPVLAFDKEPTKSLPWDTVRPSCTCSRAVLSCGVADCVGQLIGCAFVFGAITSWCMHISIVAQFTVPCSHCLTSERGHGTIVGGAVAVTLSEHLRLLVCVGELLALARLGCGAMTG